MLAFNKRIRLSKSEILQLMPLDCLGEQTVWNPFLALGFRASVKEMNQN